MPLTVSPRVTLRTLVGVAVFAILVAGAVVRRNELHRAAVGEWTRRSSSTIQISSGSARAWMMERAAVVRIIGASAARDPTLFDRSTALQSASADSAVSRRLIVALTRLNQASGTPRAAFSDLWLINRSGVVVGSASQTTLPAAVVAATRTIGETDSLMVVGPFPLNDRQLCVAFVQPVAGNIGTDPAGLNRTATIGAVVMTTTLDAASLIRLGAAAPGPTSQHTALVVRVSDSVYAYTLSKRGSGFRVHVMEASHAGPLVLGALGTPGVVQSPDGRVPSVMTHVEGLPWGLVRRANPETLFRAADADFLHEVSAALIILTVIGWIIFARGHRERTRNLRELAGSEARYRLLFETNPMPMWTFDAETGRFVAVNNAAVAHYGFTRDEFLRMTIHDVRPPEYAHEVLSADQRVSDETSDFRGRHHRKKDGTVIDVDLTVHPLPVGDRTTRLVLINDVTQKNEIEAAFRESSQFIRAILGSSPVAIIATDLDMHVVQWNRASELLFGWRADEVVGDRNPLGALGAGDVGLERLRATLLDTRQIAGREEEVTRKDGTVVKIDVSVAVIHNAAGVPAGFVTLAVDLTERTRLEAQLLQAQKMEAVGQFAGGIAHDFNNLLTVITAYAELLIADAHETAPQRADLLEIRGASARAAALVRQLLAFSRRQVLVPSIVDLNAVVSEMEQMLRRVLPPTVSIVTSLDPELHVVFADTGQLEQVLMNLVVNARDAMPEGGTLTIATKNVTRESANDVAHVANTTALGVMLTVSDTGCGMSRDVQDRIFEPFFTTKEVGKGTGLGLSTAHGIVSQSGGDLSVDSTEGFGTTFTMYLPAAPMGITGDGSAHPNDATPGSRGSGVVLLVDDEAAVRYVATRILESAGYTVLVATDGPEAVTLFAEHRTSIRLVITDMIMPTMTGTAVAAALRADDPHLPVMIMSGVADDAMASTVDGDPVVILRKPFTPEVLIRKTTEALRASQLARA